MRKPEAIRNLNPTVVTIRGDVAYDANDNIVEYDNDAVEALVASKAYIDSRVAEYPSIGDQLDALFHAGVYPEEMAATIQAVKDKYPKGGS